ncbi:unnamed protein product, partial [Ectocarpus sp. 4 AP-2014]
MEETLSRTRSTPSYRTAVGHSLYGQEGIPPGTNDTDDAPVPSMAAPPSYENMVQSPAEDGDTPRGMWPPSSVVKEDRSKAIAVWALLLSAFIAYVVYLSVNAVEMRKNPPVQILRKEEPFTLPDVVFCPSAGDGCNASDGRECSDDMIWFLSSVEGLSNNCDKYYATPSPAVPTPAPTVPTPAPTVPTPAPTEDIRVGAPPPDSTLSDDDPVSAAATPSPAAARQTAPP